MVDTKKTITFARKRQSYFDEMEIFDGRYEQEKLLGQGAFSEVWKVKDTQTGVTLALKIYNHTIQILKHSIEGSALNAEILVNNSAMGGKKKKIITHF